MFWNFQNFTLKFINGEWRQQEEANLQNNINNISVMFLLSCSKKTQINWTLKIDQKCKNQNWTLIQKSIEKENEKTGASC